MDLNLAIQFGQLINAAYAVGSNDLANHAGQIVNAGLIGGGTAYKVVTSIYANDLATDMNPQRGNYTVPIGLVLQASATGDAVIAVRGTEGIDEWIQDAKFLAVPCPFLPSAGNTEDGFTAMYKSMNVNTAAGSPSLVKALTGLTWTGTVNSLTICGHSLGGALATLLALDVAANTAPPFNNPVVYTYASPRVGDPQFVSVYNHVFPNTARIANRLDLVPKLPLPPLYDHVLGLFELNPVKLLPPTVLVKCDIPCEHALNSYLHLLSLMAGGTVIPLDPNCVP
ncbi:MAG: lipase family protein [Terriglobia bacterium]